MLSQGVRPKVVSDLLGHGQIEITLAPYSHVTARLQAVAAEAMGRLLGGQADSQATPPPRSLPTDLQMARTGRHHPDRGGVPGPDRSPGRSRPGGHLLQLPLLLTFDDWAYGDPYRATRIGAYLRSHNIRAAFFLKYPVHRAHRAPVSQGQRGRPGPPVQQLPQRHSGIIYDLHQQGLLFCRNRGPVGRLAPFPLACT